MSRKHRVKASMLASGILIIVVSYAYNLGGVHGQKELELYYYDHVLADVSSYLLIREMVATSMDNKETGDMFLILDSGMIFNFREVVRLYNKNNYDVFRLRCVVTEQIRNLRDQKQIVIDQVEETAINAYLENNC